VTGAIPNQRTWLALSLTGEGSTFIPQLDITLNLDNPRQIGDMKVADSGGNVSWTLPVPPQGTGREVWFQVVQIENGSNLVASTIE